MNIRLNKLPLKLGEISIKPKEIFMWMLLFWFVTATASRADVSEKVSQDIQRFKAFEIKSEVLKNNQGVFVTIGVDAACDFDSAVDSIQAAIDSGATEIRVASNGTYQNNLTIENQSVVIRGGFADCVAADANQQVFDDLTVIDGSALAEPVIHITGSQNTQTIRFENLSLTGGNGLQSGGGIFLDETDVELQMLRVVVTDNSASSGGGVSVLRGRVDLYGQDFTSINNSSNGVGGGGLFCNGFFNNLTLTGMSLIGNNEAVRGGGVSLTGGCQMSMYSSNHPEALSFLAGIVANSTTREGGGAMLSFGAQLNLFGERMCDGKVCLGTDDVPIHLSANSSAENASSQEPGGGLYLDNDLSFTTLTGFYANGLVMEQNQAGGDGGGVFIGQNTEAIITRVSGPCWTPDRCNLIIANSSGTEVGLGGAFYVDGGRLELSQTYLEENRADFGTAISASGEDALVTLEAVVIDDNGDDGSDDFSDFSVIRADLGATVDIRHSTVVDNNVQGSVFDVGVALNSSMNLFNSIVHDPGSGDLFGAVTGSLSINCLLAHEDNSFSGNQVVVDDPQFFDRAGGDFHLNPISPAIDMCQGIPMFNPLDIDTESRGWDDPNNDNGFGAYDAGADESYINDVIFINGFETPMAVR